ncbi:hypothetical protein ABIE76_002679 [Sinorhizobium fredii]
MLVDYLMIIDNATGEAQIMALADAASRTHMDMEYQRAVIMTDAPIRGVRWT